MRALSFYSWSRFLVFSFSLIFLFIDILQRSSSVLWHRGEKRKSNKSQTQRLNEEKFHSSHVSYDSDNKINGGIITLEYLIDIEVSKSRSTSFLAFPPQPISAFIACLLHLNGRFLKFNKSSFRSHTHNFLDFFPPMIASDTMHLLFTAPHRTQPTATLAALKISPITATIKSWSGGDSRFRFARRRCCCVS